MIITLVSQGKLKNAGKTCKKEEEMNKTKRIFATAAMLLVILTVAMLAGCTPDGNKVGSSHVHDLTRVAPKAATCLEDGNREYYTCSGCDEVFGDEDGTLRLSEDQYLIPAKGHKVASHGEKKATCSELGIKEYFECKNCGTLFKDAEGMFAISEPITSPMLTHQISKVEGKAPVGFTPGYEEHYACSNCNRIYKDALATVETNYEAIKIAPVLTDFEYKIAFTPAANIESINGTFGADYISAKYVTADDGLPATQFTFKAGTSAGKEVEAWIHSVIGQAMANGQNLRIPTFSNISRNMVLIVTNDGGDSISFRYYAENYGDKGGVDVTIGAGETREFEFSVNPGDSIGCNYALKLLSDVTNETKVTIHGFFYCEGEVDSVSIYSAASKTSFKVGESFSTDGLVLKANGNKYDEVVISNYFTDIEEGYVFTAGDIGTKTVTVAYGEYSVTYEITVSE